MSKVNVSNISAAATEENLKEFFTFSGEITSCTLKAEENGTQSAVIEFKDAASVEQAVLLTGAMIVDSPVTIAADSASEAPAAAADPVKSALDMVGGILNKGYLLALDTVEKAKAYDEKKGFSANAKAKAAELDEKYKLKDKATEYKTKAADAAKKLDEKYKIKENAGKAGTAAMAAATAGKDKVMANEGVQKGMAKLGEGFSKLSTKMPGKK